jgi:CPA2 family monovalent cation:H+ antiporter-2
MMHDIPGLLVDLALALGVAAVTTLVSRRLKLPVVFGYLMAGLVVGPNVPIPLSANAENVQVLAELGVILIMFGIGLEFSFKNLMKAGPTALLMASMQAGLVMISGIVLGRALGWSTLEGIFMGAAMVATSTVVIVKLFEECRPSAELRHSVFSVTILHDLFAIILMTVLTTLTKVGAEGLEAKELAWIIAKFCLFLFGAVGIGRYFIPRFLRKLADKEKPENLVIACIGFCFGLAILAAASGFSLAIGAFAAGMLAGESGREKMIERLIMPIRDVFTALFFVAVGMMLVPSAIADNLFTILLFVMLVVTANAFAITSGGLLAGLTFRNSFQTGIALGQFGEFGFVMMTIGIAAGVLRPEMFSITVSVAVVTALTSMFLFKGSGRMADAIEMRFPDGIRASLSLYQVWVGSLRSRGLKKGEGLALIKPIFFLLLDTLALVGLVAGYGHILRKLEFWLASVDVWRHIAVQISMIVLLALGIAFMVSGVIKWGRYLARHLAALAPNPESSGAGRLGRHMLAGGLRIIILVLVGLPVIAVLQAFVPKGPLFFAALAVFFLVLARQAFNARKMSKNIHLGTEWLLTRLFEHKHEFTQLDVNRTGTFRIVRVNENSSVLGQQLSKLDLGGRTGVTIAALLRDGQNTVPLRPSPTLMPNDRLVLSGSESALAEATEIIQRRK